MTIAEWLKHAEARLLKAGIDSPKLESQVMVAHVLHTERAWILAHQDQEVNPVPLEFLLKRREQHEPLAYMLGYRDFFGHRFRVNPSVLIPRHETEVLVEAALATRGESLRVLDLGTGSGCVAISLKLSRPEWWLTAVDISEPALETARVNAKNLCADVEFLHSDLASAVHSRQFDLIVSNPPYIGRSEPLAIEVRDFEPHVSLYAEEDGIAIFRRMARECTPIVSPAGAILMEVGYQQAPAVKNVFQKEGWSTKSLQDLSGIERVVVASRLHEHLSQY
jgi:release factor glutamine methyltransferase